MEKVLHLDKWVGETPLACIERFRADHPEYENVPMTYAGRLDPLASGVLLVLVGDECKKKDEYLGKDKTYQVKILFGVATDTHDILGKIAAKNLERKIPSNFAIEIRTFIGDREQKYPAYSSKPIDGKPLFAHARAGTLPESDEMPTKKVTIYSIADIQKEEISKDDLYQYIMGTIALVQGDFRQEEIVQEWKKFFDTVPDTFTFDTIALKAHCSTGTYMRVLADEIGKKIGIPALALSIHRLRIG